MTVVPYGNFAGGLRHASSPNSPIESSNGATCHPDRMTIAPNSFIRSGDYTCRMRGQFPCGCPYANEANLDHVRVQMIGMNNAMGVTGNKGQKLYRALSIRRHPNDGGQNPCWGLDEWHQDHVTAGGGPAPFNLQVRGTGGQLYWTIILRGGPNPGWSQPIWGQPGTVSGYTVVPFQNKSPLLAVGDFNWWHWFLAWDMLADNSSAGRFRAYMCRHGEAMTPIVPQSNVPNCYTNQTTGSYPSMGIYFGVPDNRASEWEYGWSAFGDNFDELRQWQEDRLGYDVWSDVGGTVTLSVPISVGSNDDTVSANSLAYAAASPQITLRPLDTQLYCTRGFWSPDYWVEHAFLRFDTSALPDSATVVTADLLIEGCNGTDQNGRNVVGDWVADPWPITAADHSLTPPSGTAFTVDRTSFPTGGNMTVGLINPNANISKTGFTCLRMGIDGGEALGNNEMRFASMDHATLTAPTLRIVYTPGNPQNGTILPVGIAKLGGVGVPSLAGGLTELFMPVDANADDGYAYNDTVAAPGWPPAGGTPVADDAQPALLVERSRYS